MARTPRRARSTSSPVRRASRRGAGRVSAGNYDFFQGKASVSGRWSTTRWRCAVDLDHHAAAAPSTIPASRNGRTARTICRCAASFYGTRHRRSTDPVGRLCAAEPQLLRPILCAGGARRSARSTGNMPHWRRRRAIACPRPTPFDRLTDVDTDLRAKQELGGSVAGRQLGCGRGDADQRVGLALLALGPVERPATLSACPSPPYRPIRRSRAR